MKTHAYNKYIFLLFFLILLNVLKIFSRLILIPTMFIVLIGKEGPRATKENNVQTLAPKVRREWSGKRMRKQKEQALYLLYF